jgi:NitT/TauT family transport system substrate-binding protein
MFKRLGLPAPKISFLFLILGLWVSPSLAQTGKVRMGMPSYSLVVLAPLVAQAKGFFYAEGLEVELIRMATPITVIALINRDIDYSTAIAGGLRNAMKGLPVKVLMSFYRAPLHVLNAKPEFGSLHELKGKVVGIAGFGDATGVMLRVMLQRVKMDIERDVKVLLVPGSEPRFYSLISGVIDAAVLSPPFNLQAEAKGFRRLMAAADVMEASLTTGLSATADKLENKPTEVKRMIRALLKAQSFIRDNKAETVKIISSRLKLDRSIAEGSYDLYASAMSPDGLVPEAVLESDIERIRRELQIKEKVPFTKVADFTFLKDMLSEMKSVPAGP